MDFVITFFRDILDGPLYIIVAIIAGILICSCIGYLAEQHLNKKKENEKYEQEHYSVDMAEPIQTTVSTSPTSVSVPVSSPTTSQAVPTQVNNNLNQVQNTTAATVSSNVVSNVGATIPNQVQQPIPEMPTSIPQMPTTMVANPGVNVNPMQNINK